MLPLSRSYPRLASNAMAAVALHACFPLVLDFAYKVPPSPLCHPERSEGSASLLFLRRTIASVV
jgi:hypothetical protein